jgi:hypothetical protein
MKKSERERKYRKLGWSDRIMRRELKKRQMKNKRKSKRKKDEEKRQGNGEK